MASSSSSRRTTANYRCTECGWTTIKWVGRCGECGEWGTVTEVGTDPTAGRTTVTAVTEAQRAVPISDVDASTARFHPTGVSELDRVLGGGLIPGAVILMAGEPGIGKSTLVLDVAGQVAAQTDADGSARRVLYITGEESAAQVRLRADRIGAVADTLFLTAETDLGRALGQIDAIDPDVVVVDSVQTLQSTDVEGTAGGVNQIREVSASLIKAAKTRGITTLLIGHVTKDGSIAGPRLLEHLVDVVCQFDGDRHSRLRMVRAVKNRYGSTDEVGCFDLSDSGIHSVEDPSGLFLTSGADPVEGTAITVTLEGKRPLLAEVQSLVSLGDGGSPRRTVSGLETPRVNMLIAVITRRMGLDLSRDDVYVSTVGGIKMTEPAADLSVAAAIASSKTETPIPPGVIGFGEVGLAGELRPVPGIQRRITEAARLGFDRAVVPATTEGITAPEGFTVLQLTSVKEAVRAMMRDPRRAQRREARVVDEISGPPQQRDPRGYPPLSIIE
ncbi:MAG: DNA repair protein RadA [Micrococcaceae bacterium]